MFRARIRNGRSAVDDLPRIGGSARLAPPKEGSPKPMNGNGNGNGSRAASVEITDLLGRGTRFEGRLHFEGCVRIDGWFRRDIRSDDTLVVGDGAQIHAEIDVAT